MLAASSRMRETRTSGLMRGDGNAAIASGSSHRVHPRLYLFQGLRRSPDRLTETAADLTWSPGGARNCARTRRRGAAGVIRANRRRPRSQRTAGGRYSEPLLFDR
jgi:hypothetical protein